MAHPRGGEQLHRPLSDDGRFVFFHTTQALVPEDRNQVNDAYEFNTETQTTHLISSGRADADDSYFLDSSSDGTSVFFGTREQLVGIDRDGNYDAYVARQGGGIAAQNPPPEPPECSGDGCQGTPSGAPDDPDPASSALTGPGNQGRALNPAAKKKAKKCKGKRAKKCKKKGKRSAPATSALVPASPPETAGTGAEETPSPSTVPSPADGESGPLTEGAAPAGPEPRAADPSTFSDCLGRPVDDFGIGFGCFDGSVEADAGGTPFTQAGGTPFEVKTRFDLNTRPNTEISTPPGLEAWPVEPLRDVFVAAPPGLVGSPTAVDECTVAELVGGTTGGPICPPSSQVGRIEVRLNGRIPFPIFFDGLYNMAPPPGVPARFGANVFGTIVVFDAELRGNDYGINVNAKLISEGLALTGSTFTLWGRPHDDAHDGQRYCVTQGGDGSIGAAPPCPLDTEPTSFLRLPTACTAPGEGLVTTIRTDSWWDPGDFDSTFFESHLPPGQTGDAFNPFVPPEQWGPAQGPTGCEDVPFEPAVSAQPVSEYTSTGPVFDGAADSPVGLAVEITMPQTTDPDEIGSSDLKRAVVTLPEGMAVNPASADGLSACSEAQIDLGTTAPPTCPASSKVGTVEIDTPLLSETVPGSVYLATQDLNPFNSTLALYIAAVDKQRGVVIKLPGEVSPDADTGQLQATFDNNPQLPFSSLRVQLKSGPRAPLVSPPACGTYEASAELSPWARPDEPVEATDSFEVTSGPGGAPCPDLTDPSTFTPSFSAGTTEPLAGRFSPFLLKIARPDGQQALKRIALDLPPGLVAKLAGVPRCPQAAITPTGTSCPAESRIGSVNVGAGAGPSPFFLPEQPVYLTEGYDGAPYGIAIDTHAVAGPLDLGHLVVRSKLTVDPDDAQVHITSETLPRILEGIPLHIRSVAVRVDRPGFILNPTSCEPMQITGTITGGGEDFADPADDTLKAVQDRFQVGGCRGLGFAPKLSGRILNGRDGIHRSDHPNLRFALQGGPLGDANLASVALTLPRAFQIDQANLGNLCSETQLAQSRCAGRNAVGTASATTPLLGSTLSGPVYAVSGSGGLPKLAVILDGPPADPLELLVRGVTDTLGARIRNTFPLVPDAPVSAFDLTLAGGPGGYLVNNRGLCKGDKKQRKRTLRADALFAAQNGDTLAQRVAIAAPCAKPKKKNRRAEK